MIEYTTELITPDVARTYLTKNTRNRKLSSHLVTALASDMRQGLWRQTHQGIAFDVEGNLADGQHRLAAIVSADVAVEMPVARGVPLESRATMDIGRKRTTGDMLAMDGLKNHFVVASVARIGLLYDSRDFTVNRLRNVTTPQVHAYANEHLAPLSQAASRAQTLRNQVPTTVTVCGAAFYLFYRVDEEACEQFFNAIIHMRTNGEGDPRLALMRRLQSAKIEKQDMPSNLHVVDLFLRAWNAWRQGDSMMKLPMARSLQWRELI